MYLDGKAIILTGASSGIGKALLQRLAEYDVKIIAVSRNKNKIPVFNQKIIPYACDVSGKENVDHLFEFAVSLFGKIDIFIANAGFAYCEELTASDWRHIEDIYNTNVISPLYSFEKMKELNKGRECLVVITNSAVSKVALPGYSLYCSTKAAVDSFSNVYHYEQNDSCRLSLVYPIATKTEFFHRAGENAPVPWPLQTPDKVVNAVIRGIEKNKTAIYPSKSFVAFDIMNRVFPFIFDLYAKAHAKKFRIWIANKKTIAE